MDSLSSSQIAQEDREYWSDKYDYLDDADYDEYEEWDEETEENDCYA